MGRPKIIIAIPAFNVEKVLAKTVSQIPPNSAEEIMLIDDGSRDNTSQRGKTLGLTVIRHDKNKGYGAAQKTAYKAAIQRQASAVIMVHGDNQYDPSILKEFAKKITDEGYDMVTGSRMILGDVLSKGMPIWKYIPNRLLTWLENTVFRTNISDYHNGYRAYSVNFLKTVPLDLLSDKYDFDTDIMIQAAIRKCRIAQIPHKTRYLEENSKMPFIKGVIYGLSILKTITKYLLHKLGIRRQKIYQA